MSAIELKKNTDLEFADYKAHPPVPANELDLLRLLDVLFAAKAQIMATVLVFAVLGAAVSWLLPQKWTSEAVVTPAEQTQWNALQQKLVTLQVLDVDAKIERDDVFNLFIKKFQSQSLLEGYITSSSYVMEQLKDAQIDPVDLHRAVVALSEKMKVQNNAADKKNDRQPYASWTLSFTAPSAQDAQIVLDGYIQYISGLVRQETMQTIRNAVALKTRVEQERLELERVQLTNVHNTNMQRLYYSLEVANAAGIKKPVFSNGQAVKDDPDYSVALGADGIAEKLRIEQSLKDVAELNADFRNREYHLAQLEKLSFKDVNFEPFNYQLSPSLPVKKDGPGKALIIILAALAGAMVSGFCVLLKDALQSRSLPPESVME